MTSWNPKTKPTPANIRKRIEAAQAAIDGAMDLIKQHPTLWKKGGPLADLVNAYAWLQQANRKTRK